MDEKEKHLQVIQKAIQSGELPNLYFNGFSATIGTGDVLIVLKQQDDPVLILNVSHIVAKTLSVKLGEIISHFEEKTGTTIMITDEVHDKLIGSQDDVARD